VFEQTPEQFAGHTSIIDRLLGGVIQPPTIPGALAYMGLSPEECGQDGSGYDWAYATAPVTAGPPASGAA
jgi:toluene monooxygenase system protein A